jgi:hypothetical protein
MNLEKMIILIQVPYNKASPIEKIRLHVRLLADVAWN